jgi:hypothetical protein
MHQKTYKILLIGALLLFLFPALQGSLKFLSEPKLGGYIPTITYPNFSKEAFEKGTYQQQFEIMLNRSYGFRAWFIRLYNQIQFSFFNKAHADLTIVGKNKFLIGKGYVDAYNGTTYIGAKVIEEKVRKIKCIQNTLNAQNKDLVMVIASSKGTFFSENIPDYLPTKKDTTNYTYFLEQFNKQGVNYIDFNSTFLEWKNVYQYPLYAKLGVHWSYYGAYLAVDSLLKYLEFKRGINLPDMILDTLKVKRAYSDDIDIQEGMNLLFPIRDDKYAYPEVSFNKEGKDSLKVLIIGDSFYFAMGNTRFLKEAFYDSDFWFYNNGVFKEEPYTPEQMVEFMNKVAPFNQIILLANEGTLHSFTWRFVEDLYKGYFGEVAPAQL